MSIGARARLILLSAKPQMTDGVQKARERHGKAFAHELGSDYKHSHTPKVLKQWLAKRKP